MKTILGSLVLIASATSADAGTTSVDLVGQERVSYARLSPDGKRAVAIMGDNKTLKSWDTASGAELFSITAERGEAVAVMYAAGGSRLLGMLNFELTLLDAASGMTLSTCPLPTLGYLHDVTSDGTKALLRYNKKGQEGFKLIVFDVAGCKDISVAYDGSKPTGYNAMLSPDAAIVAFDTADAELPVTHFVHLDGTIAYPDLPGVQGFGANASKARRIDTSGNPIAFSVGKVVAIEERGSGSYLPLTVFDLATGAKIATYEGHIYDKDMDGSRFGGLGYSVGFAVLSPDARVVGSNGSGGGAIWDASTGKPIVSNLSSSPIFSPSAPRAAAVIRGKGPAWEDNEAHLFDTTNGKAVASFPAKRVFALSDDGTVVLTGPEPLDGLKVYFVR